MVERFMINPVVVIPVYKPFDQFTPAEIKAVLQCCRVLKQYDLFFAGPASLPAAGYVQLAQTVKDKASYISFADHYFASVEGYNALLLSTVFYKAFTGYSHLLLYQPDAYVFKDELEHWCKKGYDYIGAPWFEGWTYPVSTNIIGVGNGGFSLRTPKKYIQLLKRVAVLKKLKHVCNSLDTKRFSFFLLFIKLFNHYFKLSSNEHLHYLDEAGIVNEDVFWGRNMGTMFTDFKVAPAEEALQFAFEANPSFLYQKNHQQLPFGCHAWEKHEPHFWQQFINNEEAEPV